MTDSNSIDTLLSEILALSRTLAREDLPAGERERLEGRRSLLRTEARRAGDASRSRTALEHELGALRRRLAQIDDRPIGKGWSEKTPTRWINDPGAYSAGINRILDDQDRDERAAVADRIRELESALRRSDAAAPPPPVPEA